LTTVLYLLHACIAHVLLLRYSKSGGEGEILVLFDRAIEKHWQSSLQPTLQRRSRSPPQGSFSMPGKRK